MKEKEQELRIEIPLMRLTIGSMRIFEWTWTIRKKYQTPQQELKAAYSVRGELGNAMYHNERRITELEPKRR